MATLMTLGEITIGKINYAPQNSRWFSPEIELIITQSSRNGIFFQFGVRLIRAKAIAKFPVHSSIDKLHSNYDSKYAKIMNYGSTFR